MSRKSSVPSSVLDWFREIRTLERTFEIDRFKVADMSDPQKKALQRITDLENWIAKESLGLIGFMAKPFMKSVDWDDLESAGNEALFNAIRHFDPDRGFQFSTYACRVISNSMLHVARKSQRRASQSIESYLKIRVEPQSSILYDKETIAKILSIAGLTSKEMLVVRLRFGLNDGVFLTRKQVGDLLGLIEQRIRQIEYAALKKLRREFKWCAA
jgi:RNA polymerase sigma factor (sigma-70 family)